MQVLAEEQGIRRNHDTRAVHGFNLDAGEDGGVEVGVGGLAQGVGRVHMKVGVLRMHLQLPKVTVERHHFAPAVASTEKSARHHAVLDLREVNVFTVHGGRGHVQVHAALHRVLVEVEQSFLNPEILGEFRHRLQVVLAAFLLAVHLFGVAFLALLFLAFLGQTFCRRKAQQGRGEGECRPT